MIAVAGAVMVLSTLPGARAGRSRSLASGVTTNTNRPGKQLALVGPSRARSQISRSIVSGTGLGSQVRSVRACRKSWSRASLETGARTSPFSDLFISPPTGLCRPAERPLGIALKELLLIGIAEGQLIGSFHLFRSETD